MSRFLRLRGTNRMHINLNDISRIENVEKDGDKAFVKLTMTGGGSIHVFSDSLDDILQYLDVVNPAPPTPETERRIAP